MRQACAWLDNEAEQKVKRVCLLSEYGLPPLDHLDHRAVFIEAESSNRRSRAGNRLKKDIWGQASVAEVATQVRDCRRYMGVLSSHPDVERFSAVMNR